MLKKATSAAMLGLLLCANASAMIGNNIALDKPVTRTGDGWDFGGGTLAPLSTVNDGLFKPEGHVWNIDTVRWDATFNPGAAIVIDLGGAFSITSFTMQADNNDTYRVEYALGNGGWATAWDLPSVAGAGMRVRATTLDSAITADSVRITATSGDDLYSVSEFQAFGQPVPEPETYAMMLAGLGLAAWGARRKRV